MGCYFRCPRGDMEAHIADVTFHLPIFFMQITAIQATIQKQAVEIEQQTAIIQQQGATIQQQDATIQKQSAAIGQLQSADEQLQASIQNLQSIVEPEFTGKQTGLYQVEIK
jgi:heterodisulfide reductase subunit C